MPFCDVIHLFFEPGITIEDQDSIFGKEWQLTLDYVLPQDGLEAAQRSQFSEQHDLWVFLGKFATHKLSLLVWLNLFLVWENEAYRHHFYHQTAGLVSSANTSRNRRQCSSSLMPCRTVHQSAQVGRDQNHGSSTSSVRIQNIHMIWSFI